jgi:hypothetical protein
VPLTRGNVPVNAADVVAKLVGTHFVKLHSLPFENGVVLAAHCRVHETTGANLDVFDLLKEFLREHG